jgi:addiction module HigA family antidote
MFQVDETENEIVGLIMRNTTRGNTAMRGLALPVHPGQFIRMEVIDPQGLSVTAAAKVLGVTRPALSALLNGRAALSPEMALRIEKAFGPKMDTLLRMQTSFEIAEARKREGEIKVERYVPQDSPEP